MRGREPAAFADVPEAAQALGALLLVAEDTAVTRRTAEALACTETVAAVRLIARAVAEADDDQADWLEAGVLDALAEVDAPDVAAACVALAGDRDAAVRRGSAEVAGWAEGNGAPGGGS